MSLVVVGGTVVDVIFPRVPRLPRWPQHTESTPANLVLLNEPPIVTVGGNGANAAYVAARCGANVTLHTQLGDDAPGGLARAWLERAGCRVCATTAGAATAMNVTAANADRERAILFYPGAPAALPPVAGLDPAPTHLLVSGWPHPPLDALAAELQAARARGIFTALDAGPILGRPWTLRGLRPVLAALDLFLTNDYEICRIARCAQTEEAIMKLRRVFTGHVVIKCGAQGVRWIPQRTNEVRAVAAPRIHAVNTVGAGDSFNGALLAALTRGTDWAEALRGACAVAASVVASPSGVLGVRPDGVVDRPEDFNHQTETQCHENLARQC